MKKIFSLIVLVLLTSCTQASTNGCDENENCDSNQFDPNNMPVLHLEIENSFPYIGYKNEIEFNDVFVTENYSIDFNWSVKSKLYEARLTTKSNTTDMVQLYAILFNENFVEGNGYLGFSTDETKWPEQVQDRAKTEFTLTNPNENAIFYTTFKNDEKELNLVVIPLNDENILINLTTGYILKNEITDLQTKNKISIYYDKATNTINMIIKEKQDL